jgi:iron complex transport system substrate-binding protein
MEGGSQKRRTYSFPMALLLVALAVLSNAVAPRADVPQQVPQRIISLIPAVTEMLFAIGAGPLVVAVSSFDEYPPEVRRLERVGALLDPDLERILALRPDLVIVYVSQADLQRQLERAKIPVYRYRHAGLADITVTIRQIGELVGRAGEAADLARRIDDHMAAIRTRLAGRPRARSVLVIGREPRALRGMYASGGVGFLHDMIQVAGGQNVFADVPRQSLQVTTELILARNPDVVLEVRAFPFTPEEVSREMATWQALPALSAVRTGRLRFIGDPKIVVPGPRIAEGTELLARALHPEAFQ